MAINESVKNNLRVEGDLDLRNRDIISLSGNLTVKGSLDLSGSNVTELPDNLTVKGDLNLSGSSITALPDNLTVHELPRLKPLGTRHQAWFPEAGDNKWLKAIHKALSQWEYFFHAASSCLADTRSAFTLHILIF